MSKRRIKVNQKGTEVSDFYKDRSVFITGATGFLGKVLVEKLLRSCPEINKIYVLLRVKHGQSVKMRLNTMLASPIFDQLRIEKPEQLQKIIPIAGDIMEEEYGISSFDLQNLIQDVSIVFHSAATTKFDETLSLSVSMNVLATEKILKLAKQMEKIEALVHLSTAYSNCERQVIEEVIYPLPSATGTIMDSINCNDKNVLDKIAPILIGDKPNTYTFTKALAENLIAENRGDLPVAIVRPSIVTAASHEPLPGWVDSFNGPTGIVAGGGKGVIRSIVTDPKLKVDIIPVDYCINLMIAVAWYTSIHKKSNNLKIYNLTSGNMNPIKWSKFRDFCSEFVIKHPYNNVLWYPGGSMKTSKTWNDICVFALQYLPALILDTIANISGKKPIMLRLHKKAVRVLTAFEFFTTHEWHFTNDNVTYLLDKLSPQDKIKFNFNISSLNWRNYFENYILGVRHYALKEDPSTLPEAKKHLKRMFLIHQFSKILLGVLVLSPAMIVFSTLYQLL